MRTKTAAQLRAELAEVEAEEKKDLEEVLWKCVKTLSREHMIVLRDLMNVHIRETYDSDDE